MPQTPLDNEQELELQAAAPDDDQFQQLPEAASEPTAEDTASPEPTAEPAPEAAAPPTPSQVRQALAAQGLDVSRYQDDSQALADLVAQSRRAQALEQLNPYVQDYLQNQAQYQEFLQSRQQAQARPPEEPKFWDAPEWNPQWLTMVRKDEATGQLMPDFAAGGTPETVQKVQQFIQYRQDQQERFWSNPFQYMQDFVDRRAQEQARGLVQEELRSYSEQQEARQFISANRQWLLEHDATGGVVLDPQNGAPRLSQEGTVFMRHLQEGSGQYGLAPQQAQDYALRMLQADRALRAAQSGDAAANTDAQRKLQFLQQAAGFTPSQAASTNRKADARGQTPPQDSTLPLAELMRRNLQSAGITDDDIANSH